MLVPFFLGATAGAIAAGRVPVGNATGDELTSWTGPVSLFVGVLAVAIGARLAAVFLGADARRAGRPSSCGPSAGGRWGRAQSPERWPWPAWWS